MKNHKLSSSKSSLIPICTKILIKNIILIYYINFKNNFETQDANTEPPTSIFFPFRFARIPIKIQGGCMSIARP